MPFIDSRVSVTMSEAQRENLKQKLGKAISIIPGKREEWLMIELADGCDLYFRGDRNRPAACVTVKVFGTIPESCLEEMTKTICGIYETELHIGKDRIYVCYEEIRKWGWNNKNF